MCHYTLPFKPNFGGMTVVPFHYAYIIMVGYMTMPHFSNCLCGMAFMSLHCTVEVAFTLLQQSSFSLFPMWKWTCAIPPCTLKQLVDPSIAMPLS